MPQPTKPLDRFTKSIVLAGGIQEDAPELLRQLPALAYVENGRFRKINEIEKTLPEEDFTSVGSAVLIEGTDNSLHVGWPFGITEFDENINILANEYVPFTTKDKIVGTTVTSGACNFSWGRSIKEGEDPFYVIAYETRQGLPGDVAESRVIIEAYNDLGRLLRRKDIVAAISPVVNVNDLGTVLVHYAGSGTGHIYCHDYENDTDAAIGVTTYVGNDIVDTMLDGSSSLPIKGYNAIRFGFMGSSVGAWFQAHYQGYQFGDGALIYQDPASRKIYGTKIDNIGQPEGVTQELWNPAPAVGVLPLDVKVVGAGVNAKIWYALYTRENVNLTSTLFAYRSDYYFSNPEFEIVHSSSQRTVINARFAEGETSPTAGLFLAFTTHEGNENTQVLVDSSVNVGATLYYGKLDDTLTYNPWGKLLDHTLTSHPAYNVNFPTRAYFTCEQFVAAEPYSYSKDSGRVSIPISILKPVSSYLLRVEDGTYFNLEYYPICAFDVNSSKHVNASMQEQPTRTGPLRFVGNDLVYVNRRLLQGEDGSVYVAAANIGAEFKRDPTFGEFMGNLYKVTLFPADITLSSFGKGCIVNSGVPIFYTQGEVQELGVLEQPEILNIFQEGDLDELNADNIWCYVIPVDEETEKWITVQVVTGFVDSLGFVHRSAPSFPVFVKGVRPAETNNLYRILKFTYPLTLSSNKFFLEIYEAAFGEVPQLASTVEFDPKDSFTRKEIRYDGLIKYVNKKESYPVRASEFVYTTGGALAADPWSGFDLMVQTSRRIFVAFDSTVHYTKLIEENTAPEMNAVLNIPFGMNKTITAMGKIDDKVIVFERDAIHAIYGDGPDNIGQGDFVVDRIQTTVGCSSKKSLVEIPEGLVFYSDISGSFHILSRDFEVIDIGGPVMDLLSDITITASTLFPKEGEIRWYVTSPQVEEFGPDPDTGPNIPPRPPRPRFQNVLPSGAVLVFNYAYRKWTVLSGQPADDVTLFKDEVYRLYGGDIFRTCETWGNAGLLKYRTPWVPVQDLQNQGRIDKVALLGMYLSSWQDHGDGIEAGDIQITSRYNYEEFGNSHTYRWRANSDLSNLEGSRLQLTFKPGQPKAQSIQILVEEIQTEKLNDLEPDYTVGRGFVMSGLDLLCKPKRGFGDKSLGQKRSK